MSRSRTGLIAMVLTIPTVAVAACGGSTNSSGGSTTSAAGFAASANGICADANRAVKNLPRPTTITQLKSAVDGEVPIIDRASARLKALTPPAGKQAAYQRYLSNIETEVTLTHQLKTDVDGGNITAAGAVAARTKAARDKAHAEASSLGLTKCT